MTSRKRVLVATDASDGANRALAAAADLAKHLDAELIIVNVEQGRLDGDLEGIRSVENATVDEILELRSSEITSRARDRARRVGVSDIRTFSGLGDAAGFILDLAKREAVDFIVVGKRGRGRLAGLLIGSVSQTLVTLAHCKVLVVP